MAGGSLQYQNAGAGAGCFEGGASTRDAEAGDYDVIALSVRRQCPGRDECRDREPRRGHAIAPATPSPRRTASLSR